MSEQRTTGREILQGHVRYLGTRVQIQSLQLRAVAAEGRAGRVRDLLALAQIELLDIGTRLGQGAHRVVADALASLERELPEESAATPRDIFYYWSLRNRPALFHCEWNAA